MQKAARALVIALSGAAFLLPFSAFAAGSWTDVTWTVGGVQSGDSYYSVDGSCSVDTGSHSSIYVLAFTGNVGSAVQTQGNFHSGAGSYSCLISPTDPLTWVLVVPATDEAAWVTYMTTGGALPSSNYSRISGTPQAFGGLDWNQVSFPLIYNGSTTALAASSSLWASLSAASSTLSCASGNIFSDALCSSLSFLFVPNPGIVSAFSDLASSTLPAKFPFSWVYGTQSAFAALSASSTANFTPMSFDFHTIGVGSTSPLGLANLAPDVTVFSSTTIMTYIPQPVWDAGQGLIAAAFILGLLADIFFTTRNEMHRV